MMGPEKSEAGDCREMPKWVILAVVCLVILSTRTPVALAAIWIGDSLEWTVADADLAIRGVVAAVEKKGYGHTVEVKIAETLKGEQHDEISFFVPHVYGPDGPHVWKQEAVEILFFLSRKDLNKHRYIGAKDSEWVLRETTCGGELSLVRLNDRPKRGVYTMDFAVLTKRDEILRAVRKCVASCGGGKPQKAIVEVPYGSPLFGKVWAKSSVSLVVPVGERLEQCGRAWVKSKDTQLRWQAPRALRHFKCTDNIKLLTGLLEDEHCQNWRLPDGRIRRTYVIRKEAYDVLQKWGAEVAKPTLEEYIKSAK